MVGGFALMIGSGVSLYVAEDKLSILGHGEQGCSASEPDCMASIRAQEDFWGQVAGLSFLGFLAGFVSAILVAILGRDRTRALPVAPMALPRFCGVCGGPLNWRSEAGRWYCDRCVSYR